MHEGHRHRMKERYLNEGLDGFQDHEVLELLLFFCVPRKNTNEIAHELLKTFGTLSAVMEASTTELEKVKGIGKNSALLLNLMPAVFRKYSVSSKGKRAIIDSTTKAGEYAESLLKGLTIERFYVISLDSQCRVIYADILQEGTIDQAIIYPRKVVETAMKRNAHRIILAHNHPGGSQKPSKADLRLTKTIFTALETIDIDVIDHIIVTSQGYYSMAAEGRMKEDVMDIKSKHLFAATPEK